MGAPAKPATGPQQAQAVDGGEIVVRTLLDHGVSTVFTLHGGHLDAIFQSALDRGLRLVDTRHEQAAGHAADGWARTTGQVGVAIVTAGPGVTDVVTAVANAYLDCVPVLVIGGRSPLADDERLPLQGGFSQVDLLRPVTKWSATVTRIDRLADYLCQALRIAACGRPGPVFLEIPADVLFARLDTARVSSVTPHPIDPAAPSPHAVSRMLEALAAAQRPLIMAGGGVWFARATDPLRAFVETAGIPVVANGKGRAALPEDHRLSAGGFMTLATLPPDQGPDVVLLLGARLGLFTGSPARPFIPPTATVFQVDIEPEEIGRNRQIDLGLGADCGHVLRALLNSAAFHTWPDRSAWIAALQAARNTMGAVLGASYTADHRPVHPHRLARDLAAYLDRETDVLVADGGETAFWAESCSTIRRPGHWLSHGYLGCLGTGIPFAMAAQIAHPESRVVCVTGDGSVGLNFAEFDTLARHGLPVVVVVNNDQQWGMSKHGQELMYGKGRTVVSELGVVRYDRAAEGFGCYGELVEDPAEIVPALDRAFASHRPACVNVLTDPDVVAPITVAMVGAAAASKSGDGRVVMPYYGVRETH
ncbi:MAG TPA: thiamine pyrophosphate-binding protein [Dehalococcoidia bacterium]|nr:thiamine pyrophosphate-binding protein [Dehalococcoidia bacterium]